MKDTITSMKDILGWINSKLDTSGEKNQPKKDIAIETSTNKRKGGKVKINKATMLWTISNYLIYL